MNEKKRKFRTPDQKLFELLVELQYALGRTPSLREFNSYLRKSKTPAAIIYRFGSWNAFVEAAGLPTHKRGTGEIHRERNRRDRKDHLDSLRQLAKRLDHTPSLREFDNDVDTCSAAKMIDEFGSWNNFVKAAGLPRRQRRNAISGIELLFQVKSLAKELGYIPTIREFDGCEWTCSKDTAIKLFGSWLDFLLAAGFPEEKINRRRRSKKSKSPH